MLASARMPTVHPLLREATQRGYVVKRSGETDIWKQFHTWCSRHAQPFVYIDLTRPDRSTRGVVVAIDLCTTGRDGRATDRFSPAACTEARELLGAFPVSTRPSRRTPPTISPIAIRHTNVPEDRAEEIAHALLAIYQRMKTTG